MSFAITPTFLLGLIVLFYLSSFVFFAIVRLLTGVSIHRLGYFSIRGIRFSKNGLLFEISRLGFALHRPTFGQPTWVSLVARDTVITVDPKSKKAPTAKSDSKPPTSLANGNPRRRKGSVGQLWQHATSHIGDFVSREELESFEVEEVLRRQEMLAVLEKARDFQKKIFRVIRWVRLFDLILLNSTVKVTNVGKLEFGLIVMSVDTRKKDNELPHNSCDSSHEKLHPIEFSFSCRTGLMTTDNHRPVPLLENLNINISGMLNKQDETLNDVAFAIKFGKINVPLHEIKAFMDRLNMATNKKAPPILRRTSLSSIMVEMSLPGSRTERLVEKVMECKEILTSILGAVEEIQVAVATMEVSTVVNTIKPAGKPLIVIMALKELGLDIHRLDQNSPAHRM